METELVAVRYEYAVLEVDTAAALQAKLNEGAVNGWELDRLFMATPVQMKPFGGTKVWAVFRRPVPEQ